MDLNTFLPIAKKFGLIINKFNNGIVEFYIDKNKYNTKYSDWYIAYFSSNKFNLVVASYDTDDKDIATICVSLKKINFPFKIEVADTNYVKTVEELEQACMELKVKLKEMLEQIKLEQINSDF